MSSRTGRPGTDSSPSAKPPRSRRGRSRGPTVGVVGAADALGTRVVQRLQGAVEAGELGQVVALDAERGAADVTWRVGPTDSPDVAQRLRGCDVVILLAAPTDLAATLAVPSAQRRDQLVRRAQAVATASAAVGARRLVAVTSAMVLGAAADRSGPLADDAQVAALPDAGVVGDALEVEQVLARTRRAHPGVDVTVLRPATLVGPGVDTIVSRHFEAPRLLVLREGRTSWQFCHLDDLADAVATVLSAGLDGDLTVGAPGPLSQEDIERLSGMRRVELPSSLAFGTAERLHRVGVLPAPASDLAYVVHPWVVSAQRLLDAGWAPRHDNEACLAELLEQVRGHHAVASRRLDRKDAALGAAGAAVALVGTAALVRRRRRKDS